MKEGFIEIENIKIPSSFSSIRRVEALIDSVCSQLSVKEDYYGNVLVAVTEAVNNAIQHGNKESEDLMVGLSVGDKEFDFCFRVVDSGNGFDYKNLPDPTAPENLELENGRGVFLMRSLAEEVDFEDGGRSVSMYFSKA